MNAGRLVGLAPLSLLDLAPPDLVEVAGPAGFDFVGVRVRQVPGAEGPHDLSPGSVLLAETARRCAATGVPVLDVEFVLLDGSTSREDWLPALESGVALGARSLTVAVDDPEEERALDDLGQLVRDGREAGLTIALEPISYNVVHSVPHAQRLAGQAGCQVLLDGLHLLRFGATRAEVAAVAPLVPLFQLCDALAQRPGSREELVAESRSERLAPGLGASDLRGYLAELPADLPVSVEVPSVRERATRDPDGYAAYLRARAGALLEADGTRR